MIANVIWNVANTDSGIVPTTDAGSEAREKGLAEPADERARSVEREAVAVGDPQQRDERRNREALHQHRERILDADHPGVQERKARQGHEEYERGRNHHPGGVAAVDRGHDVLQGSPPYADELAVMRQIARSRARPRLATVLWSMQHPCHPRDMSQINHLGGRRQASRCARAPRRGIPASSTRRGGACLTRQRRAGMLWPSRSGPLAFDPKSLDELARKLAEAVPPGLAALSHDLEQNFKAVLQGGLAKLDLVTRQEFDIQAAVLRRSRERLEELEKRIAALEKAPPRK